MIITQQGDLNRYKSDKHPGWCVKGLWKFSLFKLSLFFSEINHTELFLPERLLSTKTKTNCMKLKLTKEGSRRYNARPLCNNDGNSLKSRFQKCETNPDAKFFCEQTNKISWKTKRNPQLRPDSRKGTVKSTTASLSELICKKVILRKFEIWNINFQSLSGKKVILRKVEIWNIKSQTRVL